MKSLADVCRRLSEAGGFLTERNIKAAFRLENATLIEDGYIKEPEAAVQPAPAAKLDWKAGVF